ncbi:MAG TPA: hypothetical protein V6D17_20230 [Candidatus Obscuribacterales bacterium]
MTRHLFALGWILVTTVAGSSPASAETASPHAAARSSEATAQQLLRVNEKFRQIYLEAKNEKIKTAKPVIIVYSDHLVLMDSDRREECFFLRDSFHFLKTIDHIPLALYSLLGSSEGQDLSEPRLRHLKELRALTEAARRGLPDCQFDSKTLDRQYKIIDQSLEVMDRVLRAKHVESRELLSFCRSQGDLVLENAYEAVSLQLENIDRQVMLWKSQLGPERWSRLHVIIVGGHMPREQQCSWQYFAKLLKEKKEGDRIVYSEGPAEDADALNLMGTHILDQSIAEYFFNDKWRMHRDLLSDGAKRYLRKHPPGRVREMP